VNTSGTPGDTRRLKLWLGLIWLGIALPTAVLVWQAYSQLEFETFYNYQSQAKQVVDAVDQQLLADASRLNQRAAEDFRYFRDMNELPGAVRERSLLAAFPVVEDLPGLLGYFEVDAQGELSSPLLPVIPGDRSETGLSATELREREEQLAVLRETLVDQRLPDAGMIVSAASDAEAQDDDGGAADSLNEVDSTAEEKAQPEARRQDSLGRLRDLQLDAGLQQQSVARERLEATAAEAVPSLTPAGAAPSLEEATADEPTASFSERAASVAAPQPAAPITTFTQETEPFRFSLLNDDHAVLFRNAWRNGERVVQGALLDRSTFIEDAVTAEFRASILANTSDLVIGFGDDVLRIVQRQSAANDGGSYTIDSAGTLEGSLLHRARLSPPFDSLQLVFSAESLPPGPAARVLGWSTLVIASVLSGGFFLLYRIGRRQLQLARQQQDFVSAVSHELKTPLTSIRMYGELLKSGWSEEHKRQQYYEYIHDESERLSRLIDNVLQLSRLSRSGPDFDTRPTSVAELADQLRSRVADQAERSGFELRISMDDALAERTLLIDADCFMQIAINLIDNAIKFTGASAEQRIDCRFESADGARLSFSVRDYGPGVPRAQKRKIFELFYRPEAELTRETPGTGIGLAIVSSLTSGMGGTVEVTNRNPGAEFKVTFPFTDRQ